jgi:hypothetical protein
MAFFERVRHFFALPTVDFADSDLVPPAYKVLLDGQIATVKDTLSDSGMSVALFFKSLISSPFKPMDQSDDAAIHASKGSAWPFRLMVLAGIVAFFAQVALWIGGDISLATIASTLTITLACIPLIAVAAAALWFLLREIGLLYDFNSEAGRGRDVSLRKIIATLWMLLVTAGVGVAAYFAATLLMPALNGVAIWGGIIGFLSPVGFAVLFAVIGAALGAYLFRNFLLERTTYGSLNFLKDFKKPIGGPLSLILIGLACTVPTFFALLVVWSGAVSFAAIEGLIAMTLAWIPLFAVATAALWLLKPNFRKLNNVIQSGSMPLYRVYLVNALLMAAAGVGAYFGAMMLYPLLNGVFPWGGMAATLTPVGLAVPLIVIAVALVRLCLRLFATDAVKATFLADAGQAHDRDRLAAIDLLGVSRAPSRQADDGFRQVPTGEGDGHGVFAETAEGYYGGPQQM